MCAYFVDSVIPFCNIAPHVAMVALISYSFTFYVNPTYNVSLLSYFNAFLLQLL